MELYETIRHRFLMEASVDLAKFAKPSKNEDRTKMGYFVDVRMSGPKREEEGKFWYVKSEDGDVKKRAMEYASAAWGTKPWVVWKFVIVDKMKVIPIRHAETVRNGFSQWQKHDPSQYATF
jgi:hypothetical protein